LDDLEQRAAIGGAAEDEHAGLEPTGLSVGAQFPGFRFPDLVGRAVGLKDLNGKRVLLVYWSAACGFCSALGKDLALLEGAFLKANVQLVLFTRDDANSSRKQARQLGLKSPILLAKDGSEALELFYDFGTPAAYLLDEHGRVAHPFVCRVGRSPEPGP
jgi:peroxiredoxin